MLNYYMFLRKQINISLTLVSESYVLMLNAQSFLVFSYTFALFGSLFAFLYRILTYQHGTKLGKNNYIVVIIYKNYKLSSNHLNTYHSDQATPIESYNV